jgi:hypothetical protein
MDPFERAAKDPEDPQGSALVWRLAWSQVGNCWLEVVEECKRLKRERDSARNDQDGSSNDVALDDSSGDDCGSAGDCSDGDCSDDGWNSSDSDEDAVVFDPGLD